MHLFIPTNGDNKVTNQNYKTMFCVISQSLHWLPNCVMSSVPLCSNSGHRWPYLLSILSPLPLVTIVVVLSKSIDVLGFSHFMILSRVVFVTVSITFKACCSKSHFLSTFQVLVHTALSVCKQSVVMLACVLCGQTGRSTNILCMEGSKEAPQRPAAWM